MKNIALGLALGAAVAAPFLWEWAKPLWPPPNVTAPATDSTARDYTPPPVNLPPETPVLVETPVPVEVPVSPALPAPRVYFPTSDLYPDTAAIALPTVTFPVENTINDIKEENIILNHADSSVVEAAEEVPVIDEVARPGIEASIPEGGVLPPLAVIESEVPQVLDHAGSKLVRTSLRFVNRSPGVFSGRLTVKPPQGIRSISGETIDVRMNEGDTLFMPVVLMVSGTVAAGENRVDYILKDAYEREVRMDESLISVTEKVSLQLSLDEPLIMVTNMNDSISLSARVYNRGNTDQEVKVVMALPRNRSGKSFYELKGEVKAGADAHFTLRVRPVDIVGNENVVYVSISGLYGMQTFGNVRLGIQNVISSRRYTDNTVSTAQLYENLYVPEDITLSYRRFGKSNMYQVMGGGHMDLPAGNLSLQGLVYKMEGKNELVVLNTQLTYRYDNHSLSIGNVNEQLEYSTFGRGVKAIISDKSGKNTLKVGIVDNQYNVFSSNPLFTNGYSVFVKDHIGPSKAARKATLDYMFREDRGENARHHLVGGEWKWNKGQTWRVLLRSHGGLSDYAGKEGLVPSASSELQYSGSSENHSVSGNFYYSTAYFPGNRRGTFNLQQSYNLLLGGGAGLRANAFWSNFAPKSYHYVMNVESSNGRFEALYTLPLQGRVGAGGGYQYQTETGNMAYLANNDLEQNSARTHSHRLVENINWKNGKYYAHLGLENGVVKPFNKTAWEAQVKALFFLSYGRFNWNTSYQHGGYYLSEQNFAAQFEKVTRRLMASVSWNQDFMARDLQVNAGVNYSRDFIMGTTWSGALNSRYRVNRNYSFFLNSMVYNYSYSRNISLSTYNSTMSNVEAGLTVHLNQAKPRPGKKSKLTLTVFHDENGNNMHDVGETAAADYMILLGDRAFVTDENGQIHYSALPFGSYKVKAGAQAGWFHRETTLDVNGFKEKIEIPLRQAGSVRGSIRYSYDERTARDFVPRLGGIGLRILRNGQTVQRVMTDNDGHFLAFLPEGPYTVELETAALDANATVQNKTRTFTVEAGRISNLEPFIIEILSRKINIRQFVQNTL